MFPNSRRAVRGDHAPVACHAGGVVLVWCLAVACGSAPVAAQVPTASREELMRQWDVNRDGKVDASEAEIARGRMRRARTDAMMNAGTDPVTGKPRVVTEPLTGRASPPTAAAGDRGLRSVPEDDDGLILVPGNGERPESSGSSAAGRDTSPRPPRRESEALPGTRAPSVSSPIPSVSPRIQTGPPSLESDARSPAARPGVISGGMRAGVPGGRMGAGAAAPAGDLNAGRLPGGLPQTRGIAPGTVAGPRLGPTQQPSVGRMAGPGPSVPRPGIGPYRGATSPRSPSSGVPSVPQPGMRQPDGGRPMSRAPSTVPRTPRMTTDEFYGR